MRVYSQRWKDEVVYFAKLRYPDKEIILNLNDHSEYRWVSEDEAMRLWAEDDAEHEAVKRGFAMPS